jgi:radical SAM superfamily enzyme YgiQ (UPF0313 family)
LGLAYIDAVLEKEGHEIDLYDKNVELFHKYKSTENSPWDLTIIEKNVHYPFFNESVLPLIKKDLSIFAKELVTAKYDAVGFSVTELSYYTSRYFAALLKKIFPNLLIFWGGPEVNAKNPKILRDIEAGIIDIAFEAEAEETVQEFFEALKKNLPYHSILGLLCKDPNNFDIRKRKRPSIDYSKLPIPNFKKFNLDKYHHQQLPVMMSRGCVATCSFCTEYLTWKSYRVRTANDVLNEIKNHIEIYNIRKFFFCDSLINGNHKNLEDLADGLKNIECTWTAYCRVDKQLTKSLLGKMFQAGCRELLIGFESNSQKVLDLMNKGTQIEENQRVLQEAFEIGIKIHGLFLVGFPGETEQDFRKTLSFIHKNKNLFYVISIGNSLSLPPQSVVGIIPKKFNILTDSNGAPIFDQDGEWTSSDGILTPKIRHKRLHVLRNYLNSMELNWVPKHYSQETYLEIIAKRIFLKSLKFYYQFTLK